MLVWTLCDYVYYGKPSIIGAVNGMITGLVAITPAAGVIAGWSAICLGIGSGVCPWLTMNIAGKKMRFFLAIDDVLGVFHTHFVAGIVGGCGTGIFATVQGSAAFGLTNPGGAISGNGKQVAYQIAGACFVIGWNVVWTSLIMMFIKYVLRVPLRFSDEVLAIGDYAIHNEEAYVFGEGSTAFVHHHTRGVVKTGTLVGQDAGEGIVMGMLPEGGSSSSDKEKKMEEIKQD